MNKPIPMWEVALIRLVGLILGASIGYGVWMLIIYIMPKPEFRDTLESDFCATFNKDSQKRQSSLTCRSVTFAQQKDSKYIGFFLGSDDRRYEVKVTREGEGDGYRWCVYEGDVCR